MLKLSFQKFITAFVVGAMLLSSFANVTKAATTNAPLAQVVRAQQVKGSIKGGQFAKIWLGLEPETPGAQITVTSDWDRDNPTQNGVGFFILDSTGLTKAQAGEALNTIALAAGNPKFVVTAPSNQLGASLNATGTAKYTIVVYNDSGSDANFTLNATNGFIVDDSNQVTNPNAAAATPATTTVAGSTTVTNTTSSTKTVTPAPATPAATAATTSTTAAAPATVAPGAVVGAPGVVKATQLGGDLPNQNDQHFLGLQPSERDATITLRLTFDPQDSSELARRLNFWVLSQSGFAQFQGGSNASDVAIAAGSRDVDSQVNERVAHFKAVGLGNYTVIVYNNSRVPGSYTLSVEGGLLIDDSGQTRNAKQAATVSTTGTTTTTTTTSAATATPAAQASTTTTTTTTSSARTGTPGGSYTVKAGDTLALIARDIYGNYKVYQQLCDFNNISSCDAIEVGQVIKLPTQAQITAGITRSGGATTTTTAKPTPTPTKAASTTSSGASTTTTNAVTSTTTSAAPTPTSTVAPSQSVTGTTTVTSTGSTTSTSASGGGSNIVDTAIANGGLKTLVAALQATGADSTLRGAGPFTLFAPTDAAFAALPRGSLQQLMANPTGQLTDIVRYHIVKGKLMAADLSDGLQATTLQGKPVRFSVSGNTIKINGYRVLTKDIQAANGVIHIIETVILPPAD
ncbi:MAG: fasciclin domain-containing protein [Caldilineaceae bacterium]